MFEMLVGDNEMLKRDGEELQCLLNSWEEFRGKKNCMNFALARIGNIQDTLGQRGIFDAATADPSAPRMESINHLSTWMNN